MVICPEHGVIMGPVCPECDEGEFLEEFVEWHFQYGCLQCHAVLIPNGCVYDKRRMAFFCDKICQSLYASRALEEGK